MNLLENIQNMDTPTLMAICTLGIIIIFTLIVKFKLQFLFKEKMKAPRMSKILFDKIYEAENEIIAAAAIYNHYQTLEDFSSNIYDPTNELERAVDGSFTEIVSSSIDPSGLETITFDLTDGIDLAETLGHTSGVTAVIKGAKNWSKYNDGTLTGEEALGNTVIETVSTTTGVTGGVLLASAGAAALGVATGGVSLILMALGGLGGAYAGSKAATSIKKEIYDADYRKAYTEYNSLARKYRNQLRSLRDEFIRNFESIQNKCKNMHKENIHVINEDIKLAQPNFVWRFIRPNKIVKSLKKERSKLKKRYRTITRPWLKKLRFQFSTNGWNSNGVHLFKKGKDIFFGNQQLIDLHDDVLRIYNQVSLQKVKVEKEARTLKAKIS